MLLSHWEWVEDSTRLAVERSQAGGGAGYVVLLGFVLLLILTWAKKTWTN